MKINAFCATNRRRGLDAAVSGVLTLALAFLSPLPVAAQTPSPPPSELRGVILGQVYEIDKSKYKDYLARLEKLKKEEKRELLDPHEYLVDLPNVAVIARQLSTNARFQSELTGLHGGYMIKKSPIGAFDGVLVHEQTEYPVSQRLDLNVELSYIAELCFVVDRVEKKAWMISEGARRDEDAPPFVPERCQSDLTACLLTLTGNPEGFPQGLLLLLAGSGAAAGTLGIVSTQQTEASPPRRR